MAEDNSAGGVPGRQAPDDTPGHTTTRRRRYVRPWPFRLPQLPGARWRTRFLYGYTLTVWGSRYRIIPADYGWTATSRHDFTKLHAATFYELAGKLQADWDTRAARRRQRDLLMSALDRVEQPVSAAQDTLTDMPPVMARPYVTGAGR